MSSAFVRSSLHRARLASRPAIRSYATGPSSANANVEKAQKFAQKVKNYEHSSIKFSLLFITDSGNSYQAYEQAQNGASKLSEAAKPYLGSAGERMSGLAGCA